MDDDRIKDINRLVRELRECMPPNEAFLLCGDNEDFLVIEYTKDTDLMWFAELFALHVRTMSRAYVVESKCA